MNRTPSAWQIWKYEMLESVFVWMWRVGLVYLLQIVIAIVLLSALNAQTLASVSLTPPGTNPSVTAISATVPSHPSMCEDAATGKLVSCLVIDVAQTGTNPSVTAATSQFDQNAAFLYGQYYDKPGTKFSGGIGYASLVQKSGVYVYFGVDNARTSRVGTVVYLRSFGPINAYALLAGTVNQTATATLGGLSTAGLFEWRLKGSWSPFAAYQWDSHIAGSSAYAGVIKHWGTK